MVSWENIIILNANICLCVPASRVKKDIHASAMLLMSSQLYLLFRLFQLSNDLFLRVLALIYFSYNFCLYHSLFVCFEFWIEKHPVTSQ